MPTVYATTLFLKGLGFGFILAATVGPMWVLCLRRTLAGGVLTGLASGMGIAIADAIYGAIAAFGLTAISGVMLAYQRWIGLLGAALLVWLGIKALIAPPAPLESDVAPARLGRAFLSTLGLTLTNPPTILAFAAVFAALGLASSNDFGLAGLVVLGVFLGSAGWWLVLAFAAARLRSRIGPPLMRGINIASGIAILGFAAWQVAFLMQPAS